MLVDVHAIGQAGGGGLHQAEVEVCLRGDEDGAAQVAKGVAAERVEGQEDSQQQAEQSHHPVACIAAVEKKLEEEKQS